MDTARDAFCALKTIGLDTSEATAGIIEVGDSSIYGAICDTITDICVCGPVAHDENELKARLAVKIPCEVPECGFNLKIATE